MSSIFSKIVAGDIPSHKVAENDDFFAFLDINPVIEGHTLVIPKNETDKLFDIEDEEYTALFTFAKRVSKAIEKAYPCNRVGLTVVGLEVPHAHIHLMPINSMEDMNFFRPKLEMTQEALAASAEKIRKEFI